MPALSHPRHPACACSHTLHDNPNQASVSVIALAASWNAPQATAHACAAFDLRCVGSQRGTAGSGAA
eukprot:479441-Rhodomonas_salina.2